MEVYNEDKTKKLVDYDLDKGYLKNDAIIIHHKEIKGQKEEGHYEIVKEYPNGGKDEEWIVDKEYIEHKDAYDEKIDIQIYIPYTKEELDNFEKQNKLAELKFELSSTDYEAIKYAEGWFTEEEYKPIREYRESLREQIRAIEDK